MSRGSAGAGPKFMSTNSDPLTTLVLNGSRAMKDRRAFDLLLKYDAQQGRVACLTLP